MLEFDVVFLVVVDPKFPVQILSVKNDLILINTYSNIDKPQHRRSRVSSSLSWAS